MQFAVGVLDTTVLPYKLKNCFLDFCYWVAKSDKKI